MCQFLRNDQRLAFDMLANISGVDYLEPDPKKAPKAGFDPHMEVVYHLGGAFQGGGPFSEQEYFEINVRGTFQMLEAGLRQYEALRGTPRADHIFVAVTRYLAAHSPTDRARQQTARIALRLHRLTGMR